KSAAGWPFLLVADMSMLWVLNIYAFFIFLLAKKDEIVSSINDVLDHPDWPFNVKLKTFQDVAFLCTATAIIAEHSYFLWKQKPSASSGHLISAIQQFNSSADLKKINIAIQEASHLNTKDQVHAVVKIALENCFC
ncbi:hypothetical protein K443DRAFT_102611, partial [Laccaria amethystina LaAM-08-1]